MPADAGGLLLVHAHPDDEAFATGGVIARAVAEGRRVDLVVCTGGEEGEVHDPDLDPEDARPRMREIRLAELECSVRALGGGAINLHLLGYRDSGMIDTQANNHPDAFWQTDLEAATGRLVEIVRRARPSVLVSYDSNGNYGHPDHINAYRITARAYDAAADPECYPDAGPPHAVAKLYEIAFNRDRWFALTTEMRARGIKLPWDFDEQLAAMPAGEQSEAVQERDAEDLNPTNIEAIRQVSEEVAAGDAPADFGTPEAEISTHVDVTAFSDAKRASFRCHRTQQQDLGWVLDLPDDLAATAVGHEFFVLRRWRDRDVPADLRERDLFEGLPA